MWKLKRKSVYLSYSKQLTKWSCLVPFTSLLKGLVLVFFSRKLSDIWLTPCGSCHLGYAYAQISSEYSLSWYKQSSRNFSEMNIIFILLFLLSKIILQNSTLWGYSRLLLIINISNGICQNKKYSNKTSWFD